MCEPAGHKPKPRHMCRLCSCWPVDERRIASHQDVVTKAVHDGVVGLIPVEDAIAVVDAADTGDFQTGLFIVCFGPTLGDSDSDTYEDDEDDAANLPYTPSAPLVAALLAKGASFCAIIKHDTWEYRTPLALAVQRHFLPLIQQFVHDVTDVDAISSMFGSCLLYTDDIQVILHLVDCHVLNAEAAVAAVTRSKQKYYGREVQQLLYEYMERVLTWRSSMRCAWITACIHEAPTAASRRSA
jgi:hypothetical protein